MGGTSGKDKKNGSPGGQAGATVPEAGTVMGHAGMRPGYVGIQHTMRQADGPKARTLPGLGDVMKDLAVRGGLAEAEKEETRQEPATVRQYNQTHRQSGSAAARQRAGEAEAARREEEQAAAEKAPKSISSRSMQIGDQGHHGPAKPKAVPDKELNLPGTSGRSIETEVDLLGGGKSGLASILEAKARADAKKRAAKSNGY